MEQREIRERVRAALAALPARERRIIELYYYAGATMKQIGARIGVNESRVSQLHARAIARLRGLLCGEAARGGLGSVRPTLVPFDALLEEVRRVYAARPPAAPSSAWPPAPGVVLAYRRAIRPTPVKMSKPGRPRGSMGSTAAAG